MVSRWTKKETHGNHKPPPGLGRNQGWEFRADSGVKEILLVVVNQR